MMHSLIRLYRRFRYMRYGWFGHYASWQDAKQHCTGYDDSAILQKILAGAQKVKNGQAAWERDGVLLDQVESCVEERSPEVAVMVRLLG